jgi:hypothetical protein
MDTKNIPIDMKLDFTKGKQYNITQIDNWFNTITNPSELDTNLKNNIFSMLGSFEYSYGKYLSDVADIFKRYDESNEKKKEKEIDRKKRIQMLIAKSGPQLESNNIVKDDTIQRRKFQGKKFMLISDDVSNELPVISDDVAEDINDLFKKIKDLEKKILSLLKIITY